MKNYFKGTAPYIISGLMMLPGFMSIQAQNIKKSKQDLISLADMSADAHMIQAYDIPGNARQLSERLNDSIVSRVNKNVSTIKELTPKKGRTAAAKQTLGMKGYFQYCAYGLSKSINDAFQSMDIEEDFSIIKRGDASNGYLAGLKKKYNYPEFEGCFLSGKLWCDEEEFKAARAKYAADNLKGGDVIRQFQLEEEFEKTNFSLAQVQKGAIVLLPSTRAKSGLHATMNTNNEENLVSAFNREHVETPLLPLARQLNPKKVRGNVISGVEVINLPEINTVFLEIAGYEIANMPREQLIDYISKKAKISGTELEPAFDLPDQTLRKIALNMHFKNPIKDKPTMEPIIPSLPSVPVPIDLVIERKISHTL